MFTGNAGERAGGERKKRRVEFFLYCAGRASSSSSSSVFIPLLLIRFSISRIFFRVPFLGGFIFVLYVCIYVCAQVLYMCRLHPDDENARRGGCCRGGLVCCARGALGDARRVGGFPFSRSEKPWRRIRAIQDAAHMLLLLPSE